MATSKYLRHIAVRYVTGNTFDEYRDDVPLEPALRNADVQHLCWMYERYATPLSAAGVGKLNVCFTLDAGNAAPIDIDGIGFVWEAFELERFRTCDPREQQHYYLERLHGAMIRCAAHYGWDTRPLRIACQRILHEDFAFKFFWKKTVVSPDRAWKAQVHVNAGRRTSLSVVFFNRDMHEQRRVLFSSLGTGSGLPESVLGAISWADSHTVKLLMKNRRDYWLCPVDGPVEFFFLPAQAGEPHGEYQLGRMYWEGQFVLPDRDRGLALLRSAARKGYAHAIHLLNQIESHDSNEQPGGASRLGDAS